MTLLESVESVISSDTFEPAASTASDSTVVSWDAVLEKIVSWATTTGIKILIAILLMIITFKIVDVITKRVYKRMTKKGADATLTRVFYSVSRILAKIIILVCLVGYVGIETASISALIASFGVGISLAVQGTLSNFAGGVIIIIMRPFKLGDFITSNGQSGVVEDIKLFYTYITTVDNKVVMIPNGSLANNVIVNFSAKETRRCDVVMSISYSANADKAKQVIKEVCDRNELILKTPAPFVEIGEYADSSVNIFTRVWCKNSDYWTVNFYLLKEIREEFEKNGIEIPFNQLDVHVTNESK